MSQDVSELLKKALALPAEARAALATSLLDSLDDTVDDSVEEAWEKEIAGRVAELNSGSVTLIQLRIDTSEAHRQLDENLKALQQDITGDMPDPSRIAAVLASARKVLGAC